MILEEPYDINEGHISENSGDNSTPSRIVQTGRGKEDLSTSDVDSFHQFGFRFNQSRIKKESNSSLGYIEEEKKSSNRK